MKKVLLTLLSAFVFALPAFAAGPVCLYTDVLSGPASGGEGGNGIYLSIFGKNFGAAQGSSTVTVNGTPVAQYLVWGHDNDVTGNLDQIGVQIASGTSGTGKIVVTTPAGSCSNLTFTVRAGNIWFIGSGIENDSPGNNCASIKNGTAGSGSGGSGTFNNPWTLTNQQNIDTYSEDQQAYTPTSRRTPATYYNCMAVGDTLVFLNGATFKWGDGTNWHTALNLDRGISTAAAPLTLMARPGAIAQLGGQGGTAFGLRDSWDSYVVVSGLNLTGSGSNGSGLQSNIGNAGPYTRVVGNLVNCPDCNGSSGAVTGGVEEHLSTGFEILGNAVAGISCAVSGGVSDKQYHSMYFFGNDIELGWNKIYNGCTYNGIQINYYADNSIGFGNLKIHDNDISGARGAGINMASIDPSQGPVDVYNNLIHHVGLGPASNGNSFHACIAFPGEAPAAPAGTANVYNNTMYDCSSYLNSADDWSSCNVYMDYETNESGLTVNLVNNIMAQPTYTYTSGVNVYICGGYFKTMLAGSNNILYSVTPSGYTNWAINVGVVQNPQFVSLASPINLNLLNTSPAIGTGSEKLYSPLDFNGETRPEPPSVGAFESTNTQGPPSVGAK